MKLLRLACIAAAFACTAAAHAITPLGKEAVKANEVRIEEQYDHAQARCSRMQGHARELCNEQARGERDVQSAELRMRELPTAENDEKLRLARAEAGHALARVRCKSFDGQARTVCRDDARRVFEDAQREAKLQKDVMAKVLRAEHTVHERTAEADRIAEAQFSAARERCEALPPEGRANCLADAKQRFGKM